MNKTGKAWVAAAWVLAAALTGCDGHHDMPDTSMKTAHILCAGGETMSYEDCVAQGKEAVAVVFYLNHDENVAGTGYAVYLHDLAPEAFADSLGVAQGTSADLAAHDGNENTFALYDTQDVSSPMAVQVFDMWRYGQSAYVPSVAYRSGRAGNRQGVALFHGERSHAGDSETAGTQGKADSHTV